MNLGVIFVSEMVGTAMLVLLGCGVVANVALAKTKGYGGGFLMVNFGWGLAVFAGVIVSYVSGAHINPAVTLGLVGQHPGKGGTEFVPGIPSTPLSISTYIGAQLLGAIIGAVAAWLAYKQHFDEEPEPALKLAVFSTGPAIRSYAWNLVTEIIGTFVLVFVVISFGFWGDPDTVVPAGLGPLGALPVALLVSGSAPPSVARPGTRSTLPVTSDPASRTPSFPSRARAAATGDTPGCRSSARSSAACSPVSPRSRSATWSPPPWDDSSRAGPIRAGPLASRHRRHQHPSTSTGATN